MMKLMRLLTIAALTGAAPAQAGPDYARVLASQTLSFEGGDIDRAVLVDEGDDGATLYIYRNLDPSRDSASSPPKPALVKKNAAWSGGMWGQRPDLETSAKGALLIKSENTGVGRDRWTQTLTVIYRNKEFVVAGLTRDSYDTLDAKSTHSCDLNFLTGKGKRDGKAIEVKTPLKTLADWDDDRAPAKECVF
jgi:hypothetical protein